MNRYTWRLKPDSGNDELSVKNETFEGAEEIAKKILDASAFPDNYVDWTLVNTELNITE